MIFLIFILPILGLLIVGLGTNLIVLKSKMKQQKICRELSYKAQQEIVSGFLKLKSLNPRALKLRTQKRNAYRRLRLIKDPYLASIIIAEIALIKSQQAILRAEQKLLIEQTKTQAYSQLLKIPGSRNLPYPPFALVARPSLSMSPSYFNPIDLVRRQEIIIPWSLKTQVNLNTQSLLPMEGKCGSFIKPKGLLYQIKYSYPEIRLPGSPSLSY